MTLEILLDCPACDARLSFTPARGARRGRRLVAQCPSCAATYGLSAGSMVRVADGLSGSTALDRR